MRCGNSFVDLENHQKPREIHVCLMFVMKDKTHLFKWTDESLVEEIEEFQEVVDNLKRDVS
uniref:Uncharacterized protein n=1 Tax=Brassica oleracea TaxID=3712 RepID=A0A3P6DCL5_BRAOL|nr:unnamed protein product [Brassica oleracea]